MDDVRINMPCQWPGMDNTIVLELGNLMKLLLVIIFNYICAIPALTCQNICFEKDPFISDSIYTWLVLVGCRFAVLERLFRLLSFTIYHTVAAQDSSAKFLWLTLTPVTPTHHLPTSVMYWNLSHKLTFDLQSCYWEAGLTTDTTNGYHTVNASSSETFTLK